MLHQINGSQHIGVGPVWPCQLDSLNGNHCLANMVNTGCMGIPKILPDEVLKVRVHVGMRARSGAKEKPRQTTRSLRDEMADDGNLVTLRELSGAWTD